MDQQQQQQQQRAESPDSGLLSLSDEDEDHRDIEQAVGNDGDDEDERQRQRQRREQGDGATKRRRMLATRETAPMMGQSELTLDDSSLTHATADALSALRHWGEKLVGPRGWSKQDSTGSLDENGKVIAGDVDNPNLTDAERDNILYRDKVYMSTRYKIRDVMGDIYGHAVCNGVPNRVVNFFLIATITLSILFFVADSFNMSSSVAQCNVRNNTCLLYTSPSPRDRG